MWTWLNKIILSTIQLPIAVDDMSCDCLEAFCVYACPTIMSDGNILQSLYIVTIASCCTCMYVILVYPFKEPLLFKLKTQ